VQCAANIVTYDAAVLGVIEQRAEQGKHVLDVNMSTPPTGALSNHGVRPNDTIGYPRTGDTWHAAIRSYPHQRHVNDLPIGWLGLGLSYRCEL
jgi:hypothetical protein